jgi:hypothetical protein
MANTSTGGGGSGDIGDGVEVTATNVARPPVSPENEWRARAIAAEEGLKQAQAALQQLQTQFDDHKSQTAAGERRRQINAAATQAHSVDVDLVVMLAEAQLAQTPDADIARVVADLKRSKPFLFAATDPAARPPTSTAAGAAASTAAPTNDTLTRKAEEARASGDRRALLGYLRARRGA